ncbi:MAG: hypothetical protein NTV94_07420, partial [Planctomycetota bacterium]|nr:hypothetical protein [Planctomycetota bacterium]
MQNHTIRNVALAVVAAAGTQFADAGTVFGLLSDGAVYEIDLATSAAPVRRVTLPYFGIGYQGLEVIPGTRKMIALNYARDLVEVNMDTWTARSFGTLMFPSGDLSAFTKDLSWNPATGTLETVCVTNNQPSIYRVDVATMRLTRVGLVTGVNGLSLGLAHDAAGRRILSPFSGPNRIYDLIAGTNGSFTAQARPGTISGFDFRSLSLDSQGSGKLYSSTPGAIIEVTATGTSSIVRTIPFG